MDVIEKAGRENANLSWADWMDELLKENFERKAMGWTGRRVEAVGVDPVAPAAHKNPGDRQIPEVA